MNARILLVEDNQALADNVAEMLREEGAQVTVCSDAESASQDAVQNGFDLAIVDIGLGGKESGLELLPRLRRESAHGEILLMTGNASVQSAIQAIRSGVYAYLPKPFDPEQFTTLVKRALAQVALKRDKHALSQRLAASEALYRGVVETVEACIVGLDQLGTIRFANRFTSERLGMEQKNLIGARLAELGESRFGSDLEGAIERSLRGDSVRDQECSHATGSGTRVLRWTLTPLLAGAVAVRERASEPSPIGSTPVVLAVGIDITDRLVLERKNAEAEAMAAMGTLTTSLAHEIRNPLNAATLQLELLLRRAQKVGGDAASTLSEPAKLVRAELSRLASLLDDFLNLARPRQLQRRELLLSELVQSVLTLKEPLAQSAGVTLEAHVTPPDLTARADADKLRQVLINLVGNAIEALREQGTPEGKVEVRAARTREGVVVSVVDNGPGIPHDMTENAFKPFVTTKAAGTGLGLAIVQKIVAQHGGEAQLMRGEHGGTVAHFSIPDDPAAPSGAA